MIYRIHQSSDRGESACANGSPASRGCGGGSTPRRGPSSMTGAASSGLGRPSGSGQGCAIRSERAAAFADWARSSPKRHSPPDRVPNLSGFNRQRVVNSGSTLSPVVPLTTVGQQVLVSVKRIGLINHIGHGIGPNSARRRQVRRGTRTPKIAPVNGLGSPAIVCSV